MNQTGKKNKKREEKSYLVFKRSLFDSAAREQTLDPEADAAEVSAASIRHQMT
jgi:hypothetical protein